MTANEVIELARHNTPLPDNATLTEGLLYKTMRLTYATYREGEISKEQGTQERKNAVKQFDKYQLYEKAYRNNAKRGKAKALALCTSSCEDAIAECCESCPAKDFCDEAVQEKEHPNDR